LLVDSDGSGAEDDDSSDDDDVSSDGDRPKKDAVVKGKTKTSRANNFSYDHDDDVDVSSDSDSDTSSSSTEKETKKESYTVASIKSKIDKNADNYDQDDTEEEEEEKEEEKQQEKPKVPVTNEKTSQLEEDPATAIRPTSFRGNSFASDDGIVPVDEKRGGKKPSKWQQQKSSIYEQNGVSTVQKSNFEKPSASEPRPISDHRPTDQLGMADTGTLRDASLVKNEVITPSPSTGSTEKEKTPTRKFRPIVTKKEETVEEKEWNTEPKDDGNGPYYSYEDLKKQKIPGLNYLNREQYLSPYDFMDIFKVKKQEFETWPKWKKTKAKRKVKLF
jgi:hypothetical protein